MKKVNQLLCYGLALMMLGCATTEQAEPVSTDELKATVAEVAGLKTAADIDQAELLSFREYTKGTSYLEKAQRGLSNNYQADFILENAAEGKTLLQQALDNTRDRTPNALRILEARKSALDAGLKNSRDLVDDLADVDDDLRDETDNFARALEPLEFSEFQKKYFSLEIRAVQFSELDTVNGSIEKAVEQGAKSLAPKSLRTALLDVSEAENLIAQSPRDPKIYQVMVNLAIESSVFLTEVMEVISNAAGTPEDVAVKIVEQNRKLAALSQNVGNLEKSLETTQSTLMETEDSLKQKEQALKQQDQELQSTRSNLQETESALLLQNQELEKTSQFARRRGRA